MVILNLANHSTNDEWHVSLNRFTVDSVYVMLFSLVFEEALMQY